MANTEHINETTHVDEHVEVEHTNIEEHTTADAHGASTGDGGVVASLGINGQLFAFQLLNFAIVAVIIWFLILKPLTKKLEERKKIIDESLDKAKEVDTNLQMSQQKFQEKLDEAKVEANKIIEKAHEEGKNLTVEMNKKAQKEIEILVDQAKRNIKIEKEEMMDGLKKETVNLIISALEKILGKKLDPATDKDLIEDTLKGLKK